MTDVIFPIAIGLAVLIAIHMIVRPEVHAKSGAGAFGDARKVRIIGIVIVVAGVAVFLLRTFLV